MSKQNPQTEIGIGICGFGAMGKTHAYAVSVLPYFYSSLPFRASVRGVCTAHAEKTREICAQYRFPIAAEEEAVLLQDPSIRVIDICTPNRFHFETAMRAMRAGKHVLCEKPLCATAKEAQELSDFAKSHNLICGTVFNNRFLAPVLRARELIRDGAIGRLLSFDFSYLHNSALDRTRTVGWKQTASDAGGVLMDLCPHIFDLCVTLCGDIISLGAVSQIGVPTHLYPDGTLFYTDAEEAVYLTATLACGAIGTLRASKLCVGENDGLTFAIYGTDGALKFDLMDSSWLYYYDARKAGSALGGNAGFTRIECVGRYPAPSGSFPSPKAPNGWLRGHIGALHAYLCAVADNTPTSPSFADGAYVACLIDAAKESIKTGCAVSVPSRIR